MKISILKLVSALLITLFCTAVWAANDTNSASVTITISVSPINVIAISGGAVTLSVNSAVAGSAPTSVTDETHTYAITTNEQHRAIQASIDADMPQGVTLLMSLESPSAEATSTVVALSTTPARAVTGISTLAVANKKITYTMNATADAGVVPTITRVVTLTIVDDAS